MNVHLYIHIYIYICLDELIILLIMYAPRRLLRESLVCAGYIPSGDLDG